MRLNTFAKGAIVGAATGFIFGFSFIPVCPIDLPFWGLWLGIPIGGVLFLLLSDRILRWILACIWIPSSVGVIVGIIRELL